MIKDVESRIGNRSQAFEWYHFQLPCVTPTQISRSRYYLRSTQKLCKIELFLYKGMQTNSKAYDLPNGAIFNHLEQPLTAISRPRHYLTLNISKIVRNTDIVSMEY